MLCENENVFTLASLSGSYEDGVIYPGCDLSFWEFSGKGDRILDKALTNSHD
jgi:hypothetical protein